MTIPAPHGGRLVELVRPPTEARTLRQEARDLPSLDLDHHALWDLELMMNGAFSPLEGYQDEAAYESVLTSSRLPDGLLWPIPITIDATPEFVEAHKVAEGSRLALRHPEGVLLAILDVTQTWRPDRKREARAVFGTTDDTHPGVFSLLHERDDTYLAGRIEGVEAPKHHTFQHLRHTPSELRHELRKRGWDRLVAFQTRNPLHRAHVELTKRAAARTEANLLLHPVVGRTRPGDVDYFSRVRCYQAVLGEYPEQTTMLSILPLSMRMAGPREALWHAIIRKNFGATHFIVGRDHAGPGSDVNGKPFYGAYQARDLAKKHQDDLGLEIVDFEEMVYVENLGQYMPASEVPSDAKVLSLSGTELRRRLREGLDVPPWYSYPAVVAELRRTHPARNRQGFTVFFSGLSGAGKSTVANILAAKLLEHGSRPVTILDGDIVRKHLSSELGFSKEHRDINIRRIGFVASEITKNRGVAVCAPIAPYDATRKAIRTMIEPHGGFVLVWISTPLEVCEARDRKGLYAKARAGLIQDFTGIDDPYEEPKDAEVVIDTADVPPEESAQRVLLYLESEGYVG